MHGFPQKDFVQHYHQQLHLSIFQVMLTSLLWLASKARLELLQHFQVYLKCVLILRKF
jgi:hypothetical protein